MSCVSVMLAGIGGYGDNYLRRLLQREKEGIVKVVGLVEPFPESCRRMEEVKERGWKIYRTVDEFYAENTCDLAVLSTPIAFHTRQIKLALSKGSNVLCEKPLTGDVSDIPELIAARDEAKKFVMIGYQWSHSEAILNMKQDIMAGMYGEPEFLKTLILWPRNKAYYKRGSGWAGKRRADDGTLILDSVANNATAHYLHNIFFVLGSALDAVCEPIAAKALLARANEIENFDTIAMSCSFENGAKALFIASHAIDCTLHPIFSYRFSKGTISFEEGANKRIIGRMKDGTVRDYGDPFADEILKLDIAIANVTADKPFVPCGIETASAQVRCIAGLADQEIRIFGEDEKRMGPDELTYVDGLYEKLRGIYDGETLPEKL